MDNKNKLKKVIENIELKTASGIIHFHGINNNKINISSIIIPFL